MTFERQQMKVIVSTRVTFESVVEVIIAEDTIINCSNQLKSNKILAF